MNIPKLLKRLRALICKHNVAIIGLNGANGSGKELKGTALLELCSEEFPPSLRIARIVISDEISDHVKRNTHLAQSFCKVQKLKDKGELVPNSPIFELLWIALHREIVTNGKNVILLDGFPREADQGELVRGEAWFSMLYLKTTLKTTLERAKKRREKAIARGEKPRPEDSRKEATYRYSKVFRGKTLPTIEAIAAARPGSVTTIKGADPICAQLSVMIAAVTQTLDPQRMHRDMWERIIANIFNANHPVGKRILEMDGITKARGKKAAHAVRESGLPQTNGEQNQTIWFKTGAGPKRLQRVLDDHREKLGVLA